MLLYMFMGPGKEETTAPLLMLPWGAGRGGCLYSMVCYASRECVSKGPMLFAQRLRDNPYILAHVSSVSKTADAPKAPWGALVRGRGA